MPKVKKKKGFSVYDRQGNISKYLETFLLHYLASWCLKMVFVIRLNLLK